MVKGAVYKHNLKKGMYLTAYSADPSINKNKLREFVASKDGKINPEIADREAVKTIYVGKVSSVKDLGIKISNQGYNVPKQLQSFRDAVQFQSDSIGRYNGPVLIVDGIVKIPLETFRGGFYDFIATKLDMVPSKLEEELLTLTQLPKYSLFWKAFSKAGGEKKAREVYDKLKGEYDKGKNIAALFQQWGINPDKRARYFGLGYLLLTDNGRELGFVQRAKGMAIAADCISNPGSTPNPPFNESEFNINSYLERHIKTEMEEEFNFKISEFKIGDLYIFDSVDEVPFANVTLITPLSMSEIAERIYRNQEAIKEHPIVYSIKTDGIEELINRFPIYPAFAQTLKIFQQNK